MTGLNNNSTKPATGLNSLVSNVPAFSISSQFPRSRAHRRRVSAFSRNSKTARKASEQAGCSRLSDERLHPRHRDRPIDRFIHRLAVSCVCLRLRVHPTARVQTNKRQVHLCACVRLNPRARSLPAISSLAASVAVGSRESARVSESLSTRRDCSAPCLSRDASEWVRLLVRLTSTRGLSIRHSASALVDSRDTQQPPPSLDHCQRDNRYAQQEVVAS